MIPRGLDRFRVKRLVSVVAWRRVAEEEKLNAQTE
jgi:hypothetical protein